MATVNFIRNAKQSTGALGGAKRYVEKEEKTFDKSLGMQLVSGQNCTPQFADKEFLATRMMHHKDSPVYFYYTQSFSPEEKITGQQDHEIAKEFAARAWPESEVLIATHIDAAHIHSHFIVNAVCDESGKMLRQGPNTLKQLRQISDEICLAHGLSVLSPQPKQKVHGMGTREYRSAEKGESWKFRLMNTIDECMKYEAVEASLIDVIVVKDLSRLGRHRTQTALFIDYLREHSVRVVSATENIDTFNENDDLIIGFKGLVNDFYARDGSRRVRTGFRQKQKEGIVMIPPFGYFKDKNTKQVVIVEEAAETVRLIYSLYLSGSGMKAIAKQLNAEKRKTPAEMQMQLLRKSEPYTRDGILKKNIWDSTMVSRILRDEVYTGTLICHKSERNKINKTFRFTTPDEQFRHEGFVPAIISRSIWQQVQALIAQRKEGKVRAAPGKRLLRYGGLLRCSDCGRTFVGKRVKGKNGERVQYVCDTYHRYGKEYCSSHTIREEVLDRLIIDELKSAKMFYEQNWCGLQKLIDSWIPKQVSVEAKLKSLSARIDTIEEEMETILMERIRDKANAERYDRMIQKRESEIAQLKKQIAALDSIEDTLKQRQTSLRRDIKLMDSILSEGRISDANLRLLVEKILISECDGKLDINIHLKAPFRTHGYAFDGEEIVDAWASIDFDYDRLAPIIMRQWSDKDESMDLLAAVQ